jgi:hypothetical protein
LPFGRTFAVCLERALSIRNTIGYPVCWIVLGSMVVLVKKFSRTVRHYIDAHNAALLSQYLFDSDIECGEREGDAVVLIVASARNRRAFPFFA